MTTVAIGLGCNLGNRLRTLWAAVHILRQRGIRIAAASDVFETPPWGVQDQPLFLNACLVAETDCSPEELLALLKETEEALGRRPGERWGPREIDLDILFYGQEMVQTETLTVPHKEMANRGFVLLPLEQIDEMDHWEGSRLNQAKEILAYELTNLVHGEDEAKKAQSSAKEIFAGSGSSENMPTEEIANEDFENDQIDLISLLQKAGLVDTRSEGRRAILQGGVQINGEKIQDVKYLVLKEKFAPDGLILRKGKKNYKKVCVK